MIKRYLIHALGFILISFGIVGIISAQLGATPIDSFNYFVAFLTPLSLGTVVIITGLSVSLLAYVFNREKEMIISASFIFLVGILIDIWMYLFGLIPLEIMDQMVFRIPLATSSLIIVAYGVAITITTGLPSSPYEKLMLVIDKKINSLTYSKMIIEGVFLLTAIILGLITNLLFEQVNIFTFVMFLSIGAIIDFFTKIIKKQKKEKLDET